jgi:hypothetical protein
MMTQPLVRPIGLVRFLCRRRWVAPILIGPFCCGAKGKNAGQLHRPTFPIHNFLCSDQNFNTNSIDESVHTVTTPRHGTIHL